MLPSLVNRVGYLQPNRESHNDAQRSSESITDSREIEEIFLRILWPLCCYTAMEHVPDDDLERCRLGMAVDEAELAPLEALAGLSQVR